jgi:hypothetical protein
MDDDKPLGQIFLWLFTALNPFWLDESSRTVAFLLDDGTTGFCTFDFTAHLSDGRRLAIAVVDEGFAAPEDLEAYFRKIRPLIPLWFADGIAFFTQRGLTRTKNF